MIADFPGKVLLAGPGDVSLAASPDGATVLVTHGEMSVDLLLVSRDV